MLFFLRIAGVAQAIMLWHMLLFGDAFGPAYAIFGVFASNYALFFGGQTSKNAFNRQLRYFIVVSGVHSSQCCVQRIMCVQQYVLCVYAKYTLCVHTAVLPRNIPRNINRMTGCCWSCCCLKKNMNAPRPSEHPPVRGKKMSKRLGGINS